MINEYKNRPLNKRFQLKLVRTNETPLNSWEISNTLNLLASYYYKSELINSISLALNEGITPDSIFILTESFSLNRSYEKIDILKFPEDIRVLCNIGDPISLIPSKRILFMNIVFKTYKEINEVLYTSKPRLRLPDDVLVESFGFIDDGYGAVNKYFINLLKEMIRDAKSNDQKRQTENLDSVFDKCTKILQKHLSRYATYEKNEVQIDLLKDYLLGLSVDEKELKNIKNLDTMKQRYFDKFYYYLSRVSRPVIGIYYHEERKIQIIGKSQINKKKRDALFFDTKQISHNSPLQYLIEAGMGLGQLSIEKERLKLEQEKHEWERKKAEIEIQTLKQEQQIKEIELYQKKLEFFDQMKNHLKEEGVNEVYQIQNPYLRQNMIESRQKIYEGYHKVIVRNQLEVDTEGTQIIDLRV
jgi:hypothetical protein